MSFRPMPVIMISSYTRENSIPTLEALDAETVDFVAEPTGNLRTSLLELRYEITTKVRAETRANIKPSVLFGKPEKSVPIARIRASNKIIAIGASTGGTQGVERLLGSMPCAGGAWWFALAGRYGPYGI